MAQDKCKNCKYRHGDECRRFPPEVPAPTITQLKGKRDISMGLWPIIVQDEDWCGEFEDKTG